MRPRRPQMTNFRLTFSERSSCGLRRPALEPSSPAAPSSAPRWATPAPSSWGARSAPSSPPLWEACTTAQCTGCPKDAAASLGSCPVSVGNASRRVSREPQTPKTPLTPQSPRTNPPIAHPREVALTTASGAPKYYNLTLVPVPEGYMAIFKDRTAHRETEQQRDKLLQEVLPVRISQMLLANPKAVIAKKYPCCSIFFSDVVGFTTLSSSLDS
eukprot:RCo018751